MESRPENRLEFSEHETDVTGLPRLRVEFDYTERDLALIEEARERIRTVAERFGAFDPASDCVVLAPGSSLHLTGTVRSGAVDDGTSVCDPSGRVWGSRGSTSRAPASSRLPWSATPP